MSPTDLSDAIDKGLGRAVLWVAANNRQPVRDLILSKCLECTQFDPQCEEGRAPYLYWLIERAGLEVEVLQAILDPTNRAEGRDRWQQIRIVREFARRGNRQAMEALIRLAKTGDQTAQDELAATGPEGIRWLLDHVYPNLSVDDKYRLSCWRDDAEPSNEPAYLELKVLADAFDAEIEERWKSKPKPPAEPLPTMEDVLSASGRGIRRVKLRQRIKAKQPVSVEQLLALPDGIDKLLLLGEMNAPEIREFALNRLKAESMPEYPLEPLRASYQPEDFDLVWSLRDQAASLEPNDLHRFVQDVINICDRAPVEQADQFAAWVYEVSPCSFCRHSAVNILAKVSAIPESIKAEGIWDADSDTRKLCLVGSREN